jgi:hypothetical protein
LEGAKPSWPGLTWLDPAIHVVARIRRMRVSAAANRSEK